jgi:hypothetical protein
VALELPIAVQAMVVATTSLAVRDFQTAAAVAVAVVQEMQLVALVVPA